MKNLANYLTASNLFCGCIAIVLILSSDPYVTEHEHWIVLRKSNMILGAVFILIGGLFDLMDGWVARKLDIYTPIGKYLDSLADVVTFGVAPSMIVYKGLWSSFMNQQGALDVSLVWLSFAFLVAVGGAWRLARYDAMDPDAHYFTGVPIPTIGIFIASIPLMFIFGDPPPFIQNVLNSPVFWYILIFLCVYLMNSKIEFSKSSKLFLPFTGKYSVQVIVFTVILLIVLLRFYAIPIILLTYIFVHMVRWLIKP